MVLATKRKLATNGDTTGSGSNCPSSSAAAMAAVGKNDKGGGSLFLYGVVVKKKCFVRFLNFDVQQGGRLSGLPFWSCHILRVRFLIEQSYGNRAWHILEWKRGISVLWLEKFGKKI
jgi:hypothetical protein